MHEILKRVAPDFINNIRELNRRELNKIMSETVCHCKIRENAEIIAKILDCDIDGKIADVVEIVRCEDCIHRRQVTDTWFYCEKIYSNMSGLHKRVDNDFYCKDGERREN